MDPTSRPEKPDQTLGPIARRAWLPIPLLLAVIAGLWVADPRQVCESRVLMVLLNLVFTWLASLCICILTARSFLSSGQPGLLMFGCGSLLWGCTSLAAALLIDSRVEPTITVHNLGVCGAALCHFVGVLWSGRLQRPAKWLALGYASSLALAALILWGATAGRTPAFFVQGQGGTLIRQAVLLVAVTLFAWVAWQMLSKFRRQAGAFYYWYGLGLALVATGLLGVLLLSVQGGVMGWANRLTQYLGSAYLLVAAFMVTRKTGSWGFSLKGVDETLQSWWLTAEIPSQPSRRLLLRYGLAALAVLAALGSRLALEAWVGSGLPLYVTFYPAVMSVALVAGFGPGVLATAGAGLVVAVWILPPIGRLALATPVDRTGLVIFTGMGFFMSCFAQLYRRAKDTAAAHQRQAAEHAHEEHLRFHMENSPMAVIEWDQDFIVTRWTGRSEQIFGWSAEETVGRTLAGLKLVFPEDGQIVARTMSRLTDGVSRQVVATNRNCTKHGEVRYCTWYNSVRSDPQGRMVSILSNVIDITESRLVAEELHQKEERLRLALEAARLAAWDWHIPSGDVVWNDMHYRMMGYRVGEVQPSFQAWAGRVHPDDIEALRSRIEECMAGNAVYVAQFRTIWPDGTLHWLEARGEFEYDAASRPQRFYGVMLDITERKAADQVLHASEERYRSLFEGSLDGIFSLDVQGRLLTANPSAARISGFPVAELVSKNFADLCAPDRLQATLEAFREALDGHPRETETAIFRPDGARVELLVSGTPIVAAGSLQGIFCVASDITQRKRAEAELQQAHDDLERRVVERTAELALSIEQLQREIAEREIAEAGLLRLNRLYLVLSETNHAIVCTKDRDRLFAEVCRIAVEDGGFRLAWVGLLDERNGCLQVAASHGATGYLNGIKVSARTETSGFGPTGISIRTGAYYICNDFLNSPRTRPWRDLGLSYNVRASASIPLELEGKVIGALALYSDQKDFFDQEQVILLQQMAADVAFALENIRLEKLRQEVERALLEETAERLRTVEALREKERMLIQQSRQAAMGEMIGNIAHQWRQPLNTLGLSIQHLKMMYDLGQCTGEFMEKNVAMSIELIQHMSRTIDDFRNYFRPDKEKSDFKLSDVIESTLQLIGASFKHEHIKIQLVMQDAPVIFGHQNELAQSLLNVLTNAKDALTDRKIANPWVTVTVSGEGSGAVVTVADNAGGIPEEIIDKIFDPYFTTKGPQSGTGLGLFMSKTIVENSFRGRLTVRNAADGAEFRIQV